jgi:hypothetical protein
MSCPGMSCSWGGGRTTEKVYGMCPASVTGNYTCRLAALSVILKGRMATVPQWLLGRDRRSAMVVQNTWADTLQEGLGPAVTSLTANWCQPEADKGAVASRLDDSPIFLRKEVGPGCRRGTLGNVGSCVRLDIPRYAALGDRGMGPGQGRHI